MLNNEEMFGDQAIYFAVRNGWPAKATVKMMEVAQVTKQPRLSLGFLAP